MSTGGWFAGPNCPVQRRFPTLIQLNSGKVLLLPASTYGYDGSPIPTPVTGCYLYTPGTPGTWAATGSLNTARSVFNSFIKLADGRVMAVGGCTDSAGTVATANCEIYDPTTEVWTPVAPLPIALSLIPLVLLNDGRVVACGGTNGTHIKTTYVYNPSTNTWATGGDMAVERLYASAARLSDGRPLIYGGQIAGAQLTAEVLDTSTLTWSYATAPSLPSTVSYANVEDDGSILFHTYAGNCTRASLSGATVVWTAVPTPPVSRAVTEFSDQLTAGNLLAGGGTGVGTATTDCELYDRASNTWSAAGPLPVARTRHGTVKLSATRAMVVGGTDAAGTTVLSSTAIFDATMVAPTITSSSPTAGTQGSPFSYNITAANAPDSFSIVSGTLPTGLTLNTTTGAITGTPTGSGSTTVTVGASNGAGTGTASLTFNIAALAPPVITSTSPVAGTRTVPFSYNITATNGPTSFGISVGTLPAGLSLNTSTGVITGTPAAVGSTTVTVSATNMGGTGTAPLTFNIAEVPPVVTSESVSGTQGTAFSHNIAATNSPTSYGATGLPAGLSLNTSTGAITGTPSVGGTFSVAISATNAGGTGTGTLTLNIASTIPVVTSALTASGGQGTAFSYQIVGTFSPSSYGAAGLPSGLSVNTGTGLITGTPLTFGTFNITISATNGAGTGSATLVLTIGPAPVITSDLVLNLHNGDPASYQILATLSPTSYGASPLPAGLSINTSTGLISGTPTANGTTYVTLTATNANGPGHATLVINVATRAPVITSPLVAAAAAGTAFSYTVTADYSPTSFGASGLPVGLSINTSTGAITGTPTTSGNVAAQITATNAGGTDTKTLVFHVAEYIPPAPVITSSLAAAIHPGTAVSLTITASNSPFAFSAVGLPAGLHLNTATGLIYGTPTTTGVSNVTITASNLGGTDTKTLVLTSTNPAPKTIHATGVLVGSPGAVYGQGTVIHRGGGTTPMAGPTPPLDESIYSRLTANSQGDMFGAR